MSKLCPCSRSQTTDAQKPAIYEPEEKPEFRREDYAHSDIDADKNIQNKGFDTEMMPSIDSKCA